MRSDPFNDSHSPVQPNNLSDVPDKTETIWKAGAAKACAEKCIWLPASFGSRIVCKQPRRGSRMYSKQSESEEALWQEVKEKLHSIYGDHPPLAFQSRLDAEEMLMRGTGMIRHLKLQGCFNMAGIRNRYDCDKRATLTAWLMGATYINPLQPHTVCPKCHKTVIHQEVQDGWDLPEEQCTCGAWLKRDGHDIHLDLCEQQFADMRRQFVILITPVEEPVLRQLIAEQYDEYWSWVEFQPSHEVGSVWSKLGSDQPIKKHYALIPQGTALSFPQENGICLLPDDYYNYNIANLPDAILYIEVEYPRKDDEVNEIASLRKSKSFNVDELLKPDILERARKRIDHVSESIMLDEYSLSCYFHSENAKENELIYRQFDGNELVYRHFYEVDTTPYLPEKLTFSSIMRWNILTNGSSMWHKFVGEAMKHWPISPEDIPITQEELFDRIRDRMSEAGIQDKGVALKVIPELWYKLSDETVHELATLGFEEWFMLYLKFNRIDDDIIHKEEAITRTCRLLYRLKHPRAAYDCNGIFPTFTEYY